MTDPKPHSHVWVCRRDEWGNWPKWHCFDMEVVVKWGIDGNNPICWDMVCYRIDEIEIHADTPDEPDCCKKCWRKVHD